jgi:hypothetical protein
MVICTSAEELSLQEQGSDNLLAMFHKTHIDRYTYATCISTAELASEESGSDNEDAGAEPRRGADAAEMSQDDEDESEGEGQDGQGGQGDGDKEAAAAAAAHAHAHAGVQDDEEAAQRQDTQADQDKGAHVNGQDVSGQARKRSNPAVHDAVDGDGDGVKGKKARSSPRDKSDSGDTEKSDMNSADKGGGGGGGGVPRAVRWVFARLSHIARKSGGDRRTCVFRYVCCMMSQQPRKCRLKCVVLWREHS